jgi:hypothetical protein
MSITSDQELDARIHSFLERKTKRFPDLAKIEAEQERSGLLVKIQGNVSEWFHPQPRQAH